MRNKSNPELWRLRDQLFACVQEATKAQRAGEDTYEIALAMPKSWRLRPPPRTQRAILLANVLPLEIIQSVAPTAYPRLLFLRGNVVQTLTRGWFRLHSVERLLAERYHMAPVGEQFRMFLRERETPCDRCKVRYYGGLLRWRQRTFAEGDLDPLAPDQADLLDFEQAQEEHLRSHGYIKNADYAAWEKSRAGVAR